MNWMKRTAIALVAGAALSLPVAMPASASPAGDAATAMNSSNAGVNAFQSDSNLIEVGRRGRGGKFWGGGGRRFGGGGYHRRHRGGNGLWWAAPLLAAPFLYGGYGGGYGGGYAGYGYGGGGYSNSCYQDCRYNHGPRFCRYNWRRYC